MNCEIKNILKSKISKKSPKPRLIKLILDRNQSSLHYQRFQHIMAFFVFKEIREKGISFQDKTIADVGCGEGGYSRYLLKNAKQVVGIDFKDPKINKKNFEFLSVEKSASDFYHEKFDIIFCANVIEHIVDQNKFMEYLNKLLKISGILLLSFPPWHSITGGHEFKPFHLINKNMAFKVASKRNKRTINSYADAWDGGLYKRTIKGTKELLRDYNFEIIDYYPRFTKINFAKIPFIGEYLTWHVQYICKKIV